MEVGRPEPQKAVGDGVSPSTRLLGHRSSSLTETSVHLKSSGSRSQLRPNEPRLGWLEMLLGVFHPPKFPAQGQVTLKDRRILLLEPVIYCFFFVFLEVRRENVRWKRASGCNLHPLPPLDAGNSSHAPGGSGRAASARLIYIFRGGGWAAASSPGQCVN